jgi:hypothetical protein
MNEYRTKNGLPNWDKAKDGLSNGAIALIVLLALALTGGALWLITGGPHSKARQAVQARLKDPESAQFRNLRETSTGNVCGEVNARNEMGGYTGFKQFIVSDSGGAIIEGGDISVSSLCKS